MKLTDEQIEEIVDNGKISEQTEEAKRQIMEYCFGAEFMESNDPDKKWRQ